MAQQSETLELIVRMKNLAGRGLKGLSASLDKTRAKVASISDAVFSLKGALVQLTAGVSLGLLAREFVQTAAAFEGWRTRLNRVLGSVEEGNRLFAEMKDLAKESTAEYGEIMDSATQMAGVFEGGVDEVTKYMKITDDLAAVTGIGIREATSQVIRMYSAGAQSAEMFRDRGVTAMLGFQAGVSYTADETRKKLIAAWEDPASKIRGASLDLANTYSGLLSMIADEWQDFQVSVMDSGVFDYLKAIVATVLDTIQKMRATGEFQDFQRNVGQFIIASLEDIAKAAAVVGDIWRGWQMIWDTLKIGFAGFSLAVSGGLETIYEWLGSVNEMMFKIGSILQQYENTKGIGDAFVNMGMQIEGSIDEAKGHAQVASKFWEDVLEDAEEHLNQLATEESYWSKVEKVIAKVRDRAKEFKKATEEGPKNLSGKRGKKEQVASLEAQLKAQLTVAKAQTSMALSTLDVLYKEGSRSLGEYFDERERLITERYAREIALAKEVARKASTADKREVAGANVAALEIKQQMELTKLQQARSDAKKKAGFDEANTELMLSDMRTRIMSEGFEKEKALFEQQKLELAQRQAGEIEALRSQKAQIEEINEAHRLHELEKDKLLVDQQRKVREKQLENASTVAGGLSDIFGQMYEESGESTKAFFYLQKAAAVAEAIINANVAASKALAQGGYAGPILAAIHYAKAMMHVSQIRSQRLATGGEVLGSSPSPTADNIDIKATAGEFMQPVPVVKYYGKGVMEALRRKMIPKEIFSGVRIPTVRRHTGAGYATGGPISSGGQQTEQGAAGDTKIVNVVDPSIFEQYVAGTSGERAIINLIKTNAYEINNVLASEM